MLPHAQFAFNRAQSKATHLSPFQVVYGHNPKSPLDLIPIPTPTKFSWEAEKRAKEIQDLHVQVRDSIAKANERTMHHANKHKREIHFQPGDLVWIHLRKERFPSKRKSKLMPRSDGPFEIIEKVGPNAYKVDLPRDYGVSATFNISDLSPYFEEETLPSLRTNSHLPRENDGDHHDRSRTSPSQLKEDPKKLQEVKEFVVLCRKAVTMPKEFIHSSLTPCPGFVTCLQQDVMDQHAEGPYIITA